MHVQRFTCNLSFIEGALANQVTSQTNGELSFRCSPLCAAFSIWLICIVSLIHAVSVSTQLNVTDLSSAKILAQQKTISENSDLYLTCSAFGKKKQIQVTVYLCKGDLWIEKKQQKQDQNNTTFTIQRVGVHHSGNYSCVYSTRDDLPPKVTKKREPIEIVVICKDFYPYESFMSTLFLSTHFVLPVAQPIFSLQIFQ